MTGVSTDGEDVYLRDIWPTREEIHQLESKSVIPAIFADVYSKITKGPAAVEILRYRLDVNFTSFIPFFQFIRVDFIIPLYCKKQQ